MFFLFLIYNANRTYLLFMTKKFEMKEAISGYPSSFSLTTIGFYMDVLDSTTFSFTSQSLVASIHWRFLVLRLVLFESFHQVDFYSLIQVALRLRFPALHSARHRLRLSSNRNGQVLPMRLPTRS